MHRIYCRLVFCALILGICQIAASCTAGHGELRDLLRDGDLIFQQSRSTQATALEEATGSTWTHTGIVLRRDGRWMVAEASATVRYTPLDKFVGKGKGRRVVVKRIADASGNPGPKALEREIAKYLDRSYDLLFEWSDRRIYCSELVWKVYRPFVLLTLPQRFGEMNLRGPEVAKLILSRYSATGKKINLDEPIVTPVAIFNSKKLIQVYDSAP